MAGTCSHFAPSFLLLSLTPRPTRSLSLPTLSLPLFSLLSRSFSSTLSLSITMGRAEGYDMK